jgi:hypothetical protein
MQANALLNHRTKATKSDLYLYDLVHPLFLNGMGELGTEKLYVPASRLKKDDVLVLAQVVEDASQKNS